MLYAIQALNVPISVIIYRKVDCSNYELFNRLTKLMNLLLLGLGINLMSLRYQTSVDENKLKEETKNILYNILMMAAFSIGPSLLDLLVFLEILIHTIVEGICRCIPCRKILQR